ncbi:MAG: response regulator [Desulfobacteraceae bacterium]|jgi:PAS domain S-box-containing protein
MNSDLSDIRKILIVDDEKDFVLSLTDILENYGYNVGMAHNQSEAIEAIESFYADVVLLDVRLGHENGLNLITKIKETCPNIVPVIMTAFAEADTAIEAFQEGAYDYLRKPLNPRQLLKTLERCFEKLQLESEKEAVQEALSNRNVELEEMNTRLKESEERYRLLVETMNDGLIMEDLKGTITYVNHKFMRMMGYDEDELLGKQASEFLDDSNFRTYSKYTEECHGGDISPYELTWVKKDGTLLPTIVSPQSILGPGGLLRGSFAVITDITERKNAEEEKRNMEQHLQQAQKMESIGTLAGGISHDFNNSLQAIIGYTQILIMDKTEDNPEYTKLASIERAAKRASELTQQLLAFSRKVESKMKPVDLNKEVKEVKNLLERTIPKMIEIEPELEKNLQIVNADPSQIEQIMMNLAVNARDAIGEEGKIIIRTENTVLSENDCKNLPGLVPGNYAVLSMTDNGKGMTKEESERIFEPFFTTKAAGKGTGLGLSMVYGLVTKHNGHVACTSEQGVGTTFRIYLPAINQVVPETADKKEKDIPSGGTETVLIVDDEPFVRELGEQILSKFGYNVIAASDGETALEIYFQDKEKISLVILDLIMPGMGGKRCLDEFIKKDPEVKVIIASGYSPDGDAKSAMDSGAKGFISKPYNVKNMLSEVRGVLDAGQQQ